MHNIAERVLLLKQVRLHGWRGRRGAAAAQRWGRAYLRPAELKLRNAAGRKETPSVNDSQFRTLAKHMGVKRGRVSGRPQVRDESETCHESTDAVGGEQVMSVSPESMDGEVHVDLKSGDSGRSRGNMANEQDL